MSTDDWIARVTVAVIAIVVVGLAAAFSTWAFENAQDKRDCRRAGDVVMDTPGMNDWRCVKATPEAK